MQEYPRADPRAQSNKEGSSVAVGSVLVRGSGAGSREACGAENGEAAWKGGATRKRGRAALVSAAYSWKGCCRSHNRKSALSGKMIC